MKKDYLTKKNSGLKRNSLKNSVFILLLLIAGFTGYAQSTITITTTSNFPAWNFSYSNPSSGLVWTAVGPGINLTDGPTFTPFFNFSPNIGNGVITVSTTGTPANFAGITILQADNPVGLEITSIDVTDLNNLEDLRLTDNLLTNIDISQNLNLRILNLKRNDLTTIDISSNVALEELYLDANTNLGSLDISNNPNLNTLSAAALLNITTLDISNNPELINLNLAFVPLTSVSIDNILNQLDAFGKLNGNLDLQNTTGGVITKNGIQAYINLLGKGWTIKPPQGFDFGDAPSPYLTLISDGGAIHLVDDLHDELRLGSTKDKEADGFVSANADGDDNDNFDDEDGVDPTEFDGILTSTSNISIDVTILNNFAENSQIHAWLDLDRNGVFDPDEYATLIIAPNTGVGTITLNWDINVLGADIVAGNTFARFRYTKDNDLGATSVGGYATGGEVEDYTFNILNDFDGDGIPDIVDLDDDNDGILDSVEDNGVVDRDTDGDGTPDRIDLDADGDGCFDVTEAGFYDPDGDGELGTAPLVVDANGQITDDANGPITEGYTPPNDLDVNGTPDFQEAGAAAAITTQPTDQNLIIGVTTFSVVATADTYQWEESQDGGTTWIALVDGGDYAGTTTADLMVTNADVTKVSYRYRVLVNNIAFACDPVTTSAEVGYITPGDFDGDGIPDIVDLDDDNDGILDTVEDNGVVDRDTDGDGTPDRIDLDADGDGCFDVTEAGFYDPDGDGELGTAPLVVDANGQITDDANGPITEGYTPPNDLDANGTPDFQEAGTAAAITTQPTDQDLIIGVTTFSIVATADTYQWEESQDGGTTWVALVDGGDYAGTTTADLMVTNADISKLTYQYRVIINNIAYACDPTTTSVEVGFITPSDFDGDGIFDIVDLDDDNDGILDSVEDNGVVDRDTDGDGTPDRIDLDADGDGCFDVTEAGFTDVNGNGMLGDNPITVDANGVVTSGTDGYTPPNDLDANGTPDFQEAGVAATITTEPTDQNLIIGVTTFSVVATADTYQWEESQDGGTTWAALTDGGDYAGTTTADLMVTNADVTKVSYRYRVLVNNIAYACDPVTTSAEVGYITPGDFDGDGIADIVDLDDDNDGILDSVEENGDPNRDTDGDGMPDRIDLDADGDNCFDVTEAGFTDVNGNGMLGDNPIIVDGDGVVTSGTDGYTPPNDLDANGTPDFQEAGAAPVITTQPVDQSIIFTQDATFTVVGAALNYQWEESQDGGTTWIALVDGGIYSGVTTTTLLLTAPDSILDGYLYRVVLTDPSYACDPNTISDVATLTIFTADFDGDGVPDMLDLDDDNDGILDSVEENGDPNRDTDNDGALDRVDLDADGDGCFDVTEAGFTDVNGNGMLGDNPIAVDGDGIVTSGTDGYTPPNDLDSNGTPDFQEFGEPAIINTEPVDQDFILNGSATFTVGTTGDAYQWELSTDGVNFSPLTDGGNYTGTNTASLTVSNLTIDLYTSYYRVVVSNLAYACDPTLISRVVTYNELDDTDNDGIYDIVDDDDDNDGILDTVEGEVTDTNLDGVFDRLSLDADGDGCADTIEAGFDDPDGDGVLGTSPVTVDAAGLVVGQGGYTTPNDLDSNGVFDFQQAGGPSQIINEPVDMEIALGEDVEFVVNANATFYQWQVSFDNGATWSDIVDDIKYDGVDTSRLRIFDPRSDFESNLYRVLLTSPDYACDPNPELYSRAALLSFNTELIPNGFSPNGDGVNDLFVIPGLDQYPNFSIEIFNRYGSKVYSYQNKGSTNPQWWNGFSTGELNLGNTKVPAGTYFYILHFNGDNKKPVNGWVYVTY